MFEPGRILTAPELKKIFGFETLDGVGHLLDFIQKDFNASWMKVDSLPSHLGGDRILIFEKECWDSFVVFMEAMGYSYNE